MYLHRYLHEANTTTASGLYSYNFDVERESFPAAMYQSHLKRDKHRPVSLTYLQAGQQLHLDKRASRILKFSNQKFHKVCNYFFV